MQRQQVLAYLVWGACAFVLWGGMGYLGYNTVDSRGDKGGETPSLPLICHNPASKAEINMPELDSSKSRHNQCIIDQTGVELQNYMKNHSIITGSHH
jgi:hypothetical protein